MSKNKYPSIFSPQMEAIVFIILQIFFANLHPLYFDWELQLRGNFWKGPFFKDALFENAAKSRNFTNLFFL